MAKSSFINKIFNAGPLILLYYLCISEVDTNLEKMFEIFSLNFQIILVISSPSISTTGFFTIIFFILTANWVKNIIITIL